MRRRLLRRLRGSAAARALLARAVAGYIRLCRATGRWEILGAEARQRARTGGGRFVLAVWHGRLLMVPTEMRRGADVRAIVSRNRDGELIAGILARFGIGTLRGSSADPDKPDRDRGGREALRAGLAALRGREDAVVAVTPDGPRGPAMRVKPGVAALSALAGVPVVPWSFSVRSGRFLASWDRFLVPFPFTRGVIAWGEPIPPPGDREPETLARHGARIEAALVRLTEAADRRMGRATPPQGPGPAGAEDGGGA